MPSTTVFYASVGPDLILYAIDAGGAALHQREPGGLREGIRSEAQAIIKSHGGKFLAIGGTRWGYREANHWI